MASAPRVSVVILNYNLADYTIACVRSLRNVTYPSLDILVLDNASTEGDVQKISGALPGLSLRSSVRNTGYTRGINAGIRWAMETSPDYVLVLNPDTEVQPDFLDHLVSGMESHPRAAVACGTIYKSHQRGEVWYAGGRMIPWRGLAAHEGKGETLGPGDLGEPRTVTFVTGCLALYRVGALERIGGQDERFFLYLDDIEMSARIARKGYELLYVPKAVIHHHVKGEEENPFKLYYSVRNRLLLIRTAFSGLQRVVASLYFAGVISLKMLAWLVGNRAFFRAAAMGMEDFLRGRFGEGRGLQAFSPRGDA
jgi:GT2 family glycosyltransferase